MTPDEVTPDEVATDEVATERRGPIRVVLCDDHPAMRAAFRMILAAAGMEVVGEAGDGASAIEVVAATAPDVVLMDVRMPGIDGIAATREIVHRGSSAVLVLTTFDDDDVLFGALGAGAAGFLLKNAPPETVVDAVERVAEGDAVLDRAVHQRVFARVATGGQGPAGRPAEFDRLTERELDVLWLIAQGLTNAEIATTLAIGEATAKTHVSRLLGKLGLRDRVQAVVTAHTTGFAATSRRPG